MPRWLKSVLLALGMLALLSCRLNTEKRNLTKQPTSSRPKISTPSRQLVSERYDVAYGDKNLYGILLAPANYKELQLPTLIIAHGFNNTLEQYEKLAYDLARQGYVVYRFDFYGGSHSSKSGGENMLEMSVQTELEDLTQVVQKLSTEPYVNSKQLSLIGASQGGVVSTLFAASNPDKVHKLVLIFPAFVLFDDVKATYENLGLALSDELPAVIPHRNARLGSRYLTDALSIDIQSELQKVTAPTLIVHGTDDDVVPYQYAKTAQKTLPNAQLVRIQGGGHWISSEFMATAQPAIDHFLKN